MSMSLPPQDPQGSAQPVDSDPGGIAPISPHGPTRPAPYSPERHRLAAVALRAAAGRAPAELDAADLTVAGGDTVAVVSVPEVVDWLIGLAARVEGGEPL